MAVTTLWLACSESTVANGCMRVIPGTHRDRLRSRDELADQDMDDSVLDAGLDPDEIDDSAAIDVELAPGDVSIHNPMIVHGSNPNTSDGWRIGLTLRYIPLTTTIDNPDHTAIHVRGEIPPGSLNRYTTPQ